MFFLLAADTDWAGEEGEVDHKVDHKVDLTLKAELPYCSSGNTIFGNTCHDHPAYVVPPPTVSELLMVGGGNRLSSATVITRHAGKTEHPRGKHGGGDKGVSLQDWGARERDPRNHRLRKVQTSAVLSSGRAVGGAWPGGGEERWNQSFKATASRGRHDDPERK